MTELIPGKLYKIMEGEMVVWPVPYNFNSFHVGENELLFFVKTDKGCYPNNNSYEYVTFLIKGKICHIHNIIYSRLEML